MTNKYYYVLWYVLHYNTFQYLPCDQYMFLDRSYEPQRLLKACGLTAITFNTE